MRKIYLITALCLGSFAFAQNSKSIADFSALTVSNNIEITLIKGSENKIEATNEHANTETINIIQKGNTITLKNNITDYVTSSKVEKYNLYYKNIERLVATNGATVLTSENFTGNLTVEANTAASISLILKNDNTTAKANSGASIHLKGTTATFTAKAATAASIDAKALTAQSADLNVNTAGTITATVTEDVNAATKAAGNITVFGNPKKVNQKTSFGGSIEIK